MAFLLQYLVHKRNLIKHETYIIVIQKECLCIILVHLLKVILIQITFYPLTANAFEIIVQNEIFSL